LNGDLVANLNNLGRVINVLPRQLRNVDETVYAAKINERTEVNDRGNNTGTNLALLQGVEEVGANLRLGLLKPSAAGQNNVVSVLVQLNDLSFKLATNVRLQVANATHLHKGGR
ncbi:hypothetical protein QP834_14900, partial [Enterococcus faecalis]|nr:hypothetical protein [Enterococcus faecalis]